ncbi:MAG: hypothetical protein ACK53L_05290, partial [Pirellulaceae bacterium]
PMYIHFHPCIQFMLADTILIPYPLYIPLSRSAAEAIARAHPTSNQLDAIFLRILARRPTDPERAAALRFIASAEQMRREQSSDAPETMALADFCQILLCSNEFIYVD